MKEAKSKRAAENAQRRSQGKEARVQEGRLLSVRPPWGEPPERTVVIPNRVLKKSG